MDGAVDEADLGSARRRDALAACDAVGVEGGGDGGGGAHGSAGGTEPGAFDFKRGRVLRFILERAAMSEENIRVIGRFRPLEPGAEAAQWIINGTTLTYAIARTQTP